MAKLLQVRGPSLKKILRSIERKNMDMVKGSLREGAVHVQKKAKEMAPVVSGRFKKSIRRSVKGKIKVGEAQSVVGVHSASPAMKYAKSVESKYRIFRTLESTERKPVTNVFMLKLSEYWRKQRIK